ncbi:MAG: D-alanine--D-alanine ligase [Alphaproteobacteria bacterium]|nr:D-alanine--D-alanine ligase [Alphaproteobacteria bacterium]
MTQRHVAVLMGGWSSERDVSLTSGQGVSQALVDLGYKVSIIDVRRDLNALCQQLSNPRPDVVFNALHGVGGEDGVIQSVLEVLQIPYTHCGVTASALAMNKILSRKIFNEAGLLTPPWLLISLEDFQNGHPMEMPYVVKPINEGSSRGVYLVFDENDYQHCLHDWSFGDQLLIEKYIPGKEIQVAVVDGRALGAIEIKPLCGFYDYEAKYTSGKADHIMPAPLPPEDYQKALDLALRAHQAIGCQSVTRSDFRYDVTDGEGKFYLLEINTQPGMTPLSLVPEIAAHGGMSYRDLVGVILESASCDHK